MSDTPTPSAQPAPVAQKQSATPAPDAQANNQKRSLFDSSRFANRFGKNRNYPGANSWTIAPLSNVGIRFHLDGLGDPFHRLLGTDLDIQYGEVDAVIRRLQEDEEVREGITAILDEAWATYSFDGAILLYVWNDHVRKAFAEAPYPTKPPVLQKGDQNQEEPSQAEVQPIASNIECLRAIDITLVLNILARTRADILIHNTPLALEEAFLRQSFVCDDPRLVALSQATGCIKERW